MQHAPCSLAAQAHAKFWTWNLTGGLQLTITLLAFLRAAPLSLLRTTSNKHVTQPKTSACLHLLYSLYICACFSTDGLFFGWTCSRSSMASGSMVALHLTGALGQHSRRKPNWIGCLPWVSHCFVPTLHCCQVTSHGDHYAESARSLATCLQAVLDPCFISFQCTDVWPQLCNLVTPVHCIQGSLLCVDPLCRISPPLPWHP